MGYTITIQGPSDNNLYKDGSSTNNTTNTKIAPSAGTVSNPLPITDNTSSGGANYRGTWGYSLTSSTGTGTFIGLNSTSTNLVTKSSGSSGDGNITDLSPNSTSTNGLDTIPVYYGVSALPTQAPGTYKLANSAKITYLITTDPRCTSYTVEFNPTSTKGGTSLSGTGTMNNQTITEGVATNLNSNTFTAPTGYSFDGWNTKQDGTGTHYDNQASVTNLTAANSTITLYAEWKPNTYNLVITGDANVSTMSVKNGSTTGTSITCSKSGTTFTCSSLDYGTNYYLYPTFASGYTFSSWAKTDSATNASLGSTSTMNTYYKMGAGNGALTLSGKADPCKNKTSLYDLVSCRSKGTQTLAELRTAITTSNSGVYEYNTSVFGTASDAANTSKIYYYRGILDQTTGSYGSDGDGKAWPNYVILDANGTKDTSDTCWRIVRTTGSGGIKVIYNGKWTGSTCANATTAAQVTTSAFGGTAQAQYKSIVGVGYTRKNTYASTSATTATAYSTLFGSNTSYSGNSTASDMKTYIEGTFWPTISSYESKLEKSAGYCNDRSIRSSKSSTTVIGDSTTIVPYGTSKMTEYYFGSYVRTQTTSDKPTLGCPRSNADLYTASSATNGNKQLGRPVALITADEAAFAGSGYSNSTTPYHAKSYLRSGSLFWLLSPDHRSSSGSAFVFYLNQNGYLYGGYGVNNAFGVRPVISLVSGTTPTSGAGTATDPWVVQP